MKNFTKKLSAIMLCTMFAAMQSATLASPIDTGLGAGNGGAVINSYTSGCEGVTTGANSATLNFTGDAHVNWNTLNVNSNEALNFNAVNGANGVTVLNTVNSGMTQIYGQINANEGIGRLIISNPNGLLFDGAKITTAGDTMLTTQAMGATFNNGAMQLQYGTGEALQGVVIKDSNFSVGGEFNIVAPSIQAVNSAISAEKGLRLVTADGRDYLVAPTSSNNVKHIGVALESVQIDGDVYIASGKDIVKIVNGGEINGNLTVDSDGSVALNYVNNDKTLHVTGDIVSHNNGELAYLRNAKVDGNVDMSNGGGFLEIANTNVAGNVDLKTTVDSNTSKKHFIHVVKDNNIAGDLNIDSAHNIHIGGYDYGLTALQPGKLNVGGDINALAREGSVAVTIDTTANAVNLESGTLNIITNGKAVITANDYKLKANHYIGGVSNEDNFIDAMENYRPLPVVDKKAFVVLNGGNVSKIETGNDGYAFVRSLHDMNVDGIKANVVNLAADQSDIVIGDNNKAKLIQVDGETRNLTVNNAANKRDYTLKYTNIKDTEIITINPETEITYEMANGNPNGWNFGTQTIDNTYLVVPGSPVPPPPVPPVDPDPKPLPTPPDHDNVKVNNVIPLDGLDMNQVATPVAYAADLDDEIDTGVRKNVDGSVTVVRPFTPTK